LHIGRDGRGRIREIIENLHRLTVQPEIYLSPSVNKIETHLIHATELKNQVDVGRKHVYAISIVPVGEDIRRSQNVLEVAASVEIHERR